MLSSTSQCLVCIRRWTIARQISLHATICSNTSCASVACQDELSRRLFQCFAVAFCSSFSFSSCTSLDWTGMGRLAPFCGGTSFALCSSFLRLPLVCNSCRGLDASSSAVRADEPCALLWLPSWLCCRLRCGLRRCLQPS